MILQGRGISKGTGEGEALVLSSPFSFLGGVEPRTGELSHATGMPGSRLTGKVFVFPRGKGSTVGSYTILQLRKEGQLPAAIVNEKAETIVATGAVMAGVPMVDSVDLSLLQQGDTLTVDGACGTVEIHGVKEARVVTCVLSHKGRILALRRSDKVSSCQNMWAGVSGYIEGDEAPLDRAFKEVAEETSIKGCKLVRQGPAMMVRREGTIWTIHPFLMESPQEQVIIDWEHTEYRWIEPSQVDEHLTVPGFRAVLRSLGL